MTVTSGPEYSFAGMDGVSARYEPNGRFFINASGLTATQLECVKACLANLLSSSNGNELDGQAGSNPGGNRDLPRDLGPSGG